MISTNDIQASSVSLEIVSDWLILGSFALYLTPSHLSLVNFRILSWKYSVYLLVKSWFFERKLERKKGAFLTFEDRGVYVFLLLFILFGVCSCFKTFDQGNWIYCKYIFILWSSQSYRERVFCGDVFFKGCRPMFVLLKYSKHFFISNLN